MKSALPLIAARCLQTLSLSIFIGGIAMIGAVVAPIAFKHSGLNTEQAGVVVGGSLARFNFLCYVAGGLLLFAQGMEWNALKPVNGLRKILSWRLGLSAVVLGLALFLGLVMMPSMIHNQQTGRMEVFQSQHKQYELLSQLEFWGAVGIALLSAMASVPRALLNPATEPLERAVLR